VSRFGLPAAVRGLLLDAGNTLVFLDMEAVASTVFPLGLEVSVDQLRLSEAGAKREYMRFMAAGGSHDAGWDRFMAQLLSGAGASQGQLTSGVLALREEQSRFNLWRRVPSGLSEALGRAQESGFRLGVLSNSEGKISELLQQVGLAAHFEVIVDSALVGMAKPDPGIFELAAQGLDLKVEEVVYIGDIPDVDVLGAQRAGMAAILIDPYAHFPEFAASPRCASVVEVITDLLRQG
jgi:HAD superfamily hydrolase (TIGR01509 family)